jgi:hypothetical protein
MVYATTTLPELLATVAKDLAACIKLNCQLGSFILFL